MTKEEYAEYLRSTSWKRTRARFWRSRGGSATCEVCEAAPATDVHHRTYTYVGREKLKHLAAVCRPCHTALHELIARNGHRIAAIPQLRAQIRKNRKKFL